jgi:hypothetical protein
MFNAVSRTFIALSRRFPVEMGAASCARSLLAEQRSLELVAKDIVVDGEPVWQMM